MLQRTFNLTRETIHHGKTEVSKMSFGILLQNLFHVPACLIVLAVVHERDSVIKVFFRRFEVGGRPAQLLIAIVQVDASPIGKLSRSRGDNLFQQAFRLLELVFLHSLEASLVVLHSLCKSRVSLESVLWLRGWGFLRRHRLSFPNNLCFVGLSRRTFNVCCHFSLHSIVSLRPTVESR